MQMKVLRLLATLGLGAAVFAGGGTRAEAAVISFDQVVDGGFLSYGGNIGDPIIGSAIRFDVIDDGTLFLNCVGCTMNFTSGGSTSEGAITTEFGAGGSFTISGQAFSAGADGIRGTADDVLEASGVLVSGSFTPSALIDGGTVLTFNGFGIDTKNQDLLDFFGITATDFTFASTAISATYAGDPRAGFAGVAVEDADFTNTAVASPEPATMSLFGLALLGLGGAVRRRFTA